MTLVNALRYVMSRHYPCRFQKAQAPFLKGQRLTEPDAGLRGQWPGREERRPEESLGDSGFPKSLLSPVLVTLSAGTWRGPSCWRQ